jgi:hypothetical protein
MFPVRYERGFYITEKGILHTHCRENLKSFIASTGWALLRRREVSSVMYGLGFYIPEDGILRVVFYLKNMKIKLFRNGILCFCM